MFFTTAFALSLAVIGGVAAPSVKRDENTSVVDIVGFGELNATYIPKLASAGLTIDPDAAATVNLGPYLSAIESNSQALVSAVGTTTVLGLEAGAVFAQAISELGVTETGVSVAVKYDEDGIPVVEVASGTAKITLATGTENGGVPTTFAEHPFLAAPAKNGAFVDQQIPRPLLSGMAVAVGSVIMGVLVVI